MIGILRLIVDRIIEDEGRSFQAFDRETFGRQERHPPRNPFADRIVDCRVIAEIKRGSPSRGIIRGDADPASIAQAYERGGASAISVVTEKNFFFGGKEMLPTVKAATGLPLLRKDFIVHERQVYESYNLGADLILLIAACLDAKALKQLHHCAETLSLRPLVEVHDKRELDDALEAGAGLIGVNNRDLETFEVDWTRSLRLRKHIPDGITLISESGITSHEQVKELQAAGYSGVLVGEHLMRHPDPARAIQGLIHG